MILFLNNETDNINYLIGKIEENDSIRWGESTIIGGGFRPKAILTDSNQVIQIHSSISDFNNSELSHSKIKSRIGIILTDQLKIEWQQLEREIVDGYYPSICLNDKGIIIMSYSDSQNRVEFLIGQINIENNQNEEKIKWYKENCAQMIKQKEACVIIKKNKIIVSSRAANNYDLFFTIGEVIKPNQEDSPKTPREYKELPERKNGDCIKWIQTYCYDNGCYPCLAIHENGTILETHKSQRRSALFYHLCRFSEKSKLVKYKISSKFDSGIDSSLIFLDENNLIEIHKSQMNDILWIKSTLR